MINKKNATKEVYKMGVNRLTGSPWHTERVHRADGDDRRYKGRCKHYSYEDDKCKLKICKCIGSAHCEKYLAISEEEFKQRQKRHTQIKANSDDDTYWF
ncbi:MAG: hypothetical protein IKU29_11660 [Parabacteroides sp.]|nr:hypothetical protein [Parabacteroides sp.]